MRKFFIALLGLAGLGVLVFVAVIVVDLYNASATGDKNQAAAQQQADTFAQRYAAGVGLLLKQNAGARLTDAELAPPVVIGGPQFGGATPKLTYQGTHALVARTDGPSSLSLTIQIESPYAASMGAQGVLWTCYEVTAPTGQQAAAPTAARLPDCPSAKP